MFSEIYFGFSIHILYFWGKRGIKKPKVRYLWRTAAQFGESKSVLCTVLASDPGSVFGCCHDEQVRRCGGREGANVLCSHPAAEAPCNCDWLWVMQRITASLRASIAMAIMRPNITSPPRMAEKNNQECLR